MSLPDTVFIFVLALIIFGPKKLPEIGRQLGKLVGEFRRASNEFKFQIEEELRQVELTDRPAMATPKKELESSEPAPSMETLPGEADSSSSPDLSYADETLPVGQHPNIDNLDSYELNSLDRQPAEAEAAGDHTQEEATAELATASLSITPATGTEPRSTPPYVTSIPDHPATPAEESSSSGRSESLELFPDLADTDAPSTPNSTPAPAHEPAEPYAAPSIADVTHG
jgi:sec-independent protein translocase protein TatB